MDTKLLSILRLYKKKLSIPSHMIVAISGWASKLIVVFVQLFSIRLLISGLGLEGYATFGLLSALLGWFMLADFGIGSSLQNQISQQRAFDKTYGEDIVVSVFLCAALLAITIAALYFISPYFAPFYLKKFIHIDDVEKTRIFFISGSLFIGCALGSVSYKIWIAEHKGFISNLLPAIAGLVSYVGILILHSVEGMSNNILWNLIVFFTPYTLLPVCAITLQFLTHYKTVRISSVNINKVYKIMSSALAFWFFAAITSLSLQVDYLILSQYLESRDMVVYNLATKFFWFVLFLYISGLTSIWPVFSESLAKDDWMYVKALTRKYLKFGLSFAIATTFLLILFMPYVVSLLAPNQNLIVPFGFLILLGIYQLIRVWSDTFTMILQSIGDTNSLIKVGIFQAFFSIILQWYLVQILGIDGIILGNILSFLMTFFWIAPLIVLKHYKSHSLIVSAI